MAPDVMYLVAEPRLVARVALIAHLRDDLRILLRLPGQVTGFLDRPAERLLDVDVLAQVHCCRRDRRVHVVRCRDDHRVDVFLLLEHLAIVAVPRNLIHLLIEEPAHVLGSVDPRPLFVGRKLGCGGLSTRPRARTGRRLLRSGGRRCSDLFSLALDARIDQREIHVAESGDVLAQDVAGIAEAHTAHANRCDIHGVAGRLKATPEHMPGHDDQPGPCHCRPGHEFTPRHTCRFGGVRLSFVSFRHGKPRMV